MQISDQLIEHLMIAARGIAWDKGVTVSEAEIARQHTRQVLEAALSAAEPQPAPSVAVKALQMADETFRDLGWHDKYEATTAALAVLSAQVQDVAGWQPIETAPKDGTNILVWADGYQWPEVVRYEIYDDPIVEAEAGEKGYWRFSEDLLADITHIDKDEISHWMPLPEAPK